MGRTSESDVLVIGLGRFGAAAAVELRRLGHKVVGLERDAVRAERFIAEHGNFDAIVFGVGVNGHVALNEPGVDPTLRTHVAEVSSVTADVAQKYFEGETPKLTKGVTIGIGNAREARKLYVMANSPQKCPVVERAIELLARRESSVDLPASFVLSLPQTEFCVTDEVFGE